MNQRCAWVNSPDPIYAEYHDTEWGVPEYDPRALWEKLMLDGFQAGLAWITILRKRETMRAQHPARIRRVQRIIRHIRIQIHLIRIADRIGL